ncbi:MAG TPA: hypothetical protein VGV57_02015 [Thermoleophilaceae bacterium]|nr:hypothetical protein [Thermoleophilaceae bacterium]
MTVATPPKPAEEGRAPTREVPEPRPRSRASGPSDRATRTTATGCLLGIAITHTFEVESKLDSAPYVGVMFLALIGGATTLALMFAKRWRLELAWPTAALLGATSIAAYVWSRGIGLPGIEDHIGHWNDPLGTAAVVFEATLVGLSLPALRRRTLRFSTPAAFVASGLVVGGLMLTGGGHHGGGAGHHDGMDIDAATRAQQAQARQFQAATTSNAQQRFPTFDAARAAGYVFAPRSFEQQKDLDYWHVTNKSYLKDKRDLDPARPESLMYWHDPDGRPQLLAAVFRVPTRKANPALGGPIIQWHVHRNAKGGLGRYKMTHVWMLPRLRHAYSMSMPTKRFQHRFEGLPDNGSGAGA